MTYAPDLSRAVAEARETLLALARADLHPSARDCHLDYAIRSFMTLGAIMLRLAEARKASQPTVRQLKSGAQPRPRVVSNTRPLDIIPFDPAERDIAHMIQTAKAEGVVR